MFDLESVDESLPLRNHASSLDRIALESGSNPESLRAQWVHALPRALHFYRQSKLLKATTCDSCRMAWEDAIDHCSKLRGAPRTDELRKALATYFVAAISTSGVEQNFSQAMQRAHSQISANADKEELLLKVIMGADVYPQEKLLRLCRKVWVHCFRTSRLFKMRTTKAVKRIKQEIDKTKKPKTEAEFIKRRRLAASATTEAADHVDLATWRPSNPARRPDSWTDKHTTELNRQIALRASRRLDIIGEGGVQGSAEDLRAIADKRAKQEKAQRERERREGRADKQALGAPVAQCREWCRGKTVFVDPDCRSEPLSASLRRHAMANKFKTIESMVVVVPNPGVEMQSPRYRTICAVLGGCMVSPSFLTSTGSGGAL